MGGAKSKSCLNTYENPDLLKVVTLSDATVQRLPTDGERSPSDVEHRNQTIDDFWRKRLECMSESFMESKNLTEKEFARLEDKIKRMAPGKGRINCPRQVEDVTTCYLVYGKQAMICEDLVRKMELCLDTMMMDAARKRHREAQRQEKKGKKKCT